MWSTITCHYTTLFRSEGDAEVGAARFHVRDQRLGMHRAHAAIDVQAVGRDADRAHPGAEFGEDLRRDMVGGAMRAVRSEEHTSELQSLRDLVWSIVLA